MRRRENECAGWRVDGDHLGLGGTAAFIVRAGELILRKKAAQGWGDIQRDVASRFSKAIALGKGGRNLDTKVEWVSTEALVVVKEFTLNRCPFPLRGSRRQVSVAGVAIGRTDDNS